jgi:ankyrin repeat protein
MDKIFDVVAFGTNLQLVEIIEAGVNVNCQDRSKRTPLIYATIDCKLDMMEILISNGADVNIQDSLGWCALHFAAQNNSSDACRLLLENSAIVDFQEMHGNTPLFKAVFNSRGNGEAIELLRTYGADINLENNYGVSPLKLANTIANYDVARFMK